MMPVIGLTCGSEMTSHGTIDHRVNEDYVRAVAAAGAVPVLLPPLHDPAQVDGFLSFLDGLVLPGGVDVDPAYYSEEPLHSLGQVDPDRDESELALTRAALAQGVPVLGICRGIQLLNVAAGGSLYQDLEVQMKASIKHEQQAPRWYPTHEVRLDVSSKLYEILGQEVLRVNSFHHQAVKIPGEGFLVAAKARDGVIEAIESRDHPFAIGVQWHVECLWEREPLFARLFARLVAEAKNYQVRRMARAEAATESAAASRCETR